MKSGLAGKTAMVTGAAQGLGRAIAESLAGAGASVMLADVDGGKVAEAGRAIRQGGGKSLAVKADVSRLRDLDKLVSRTVEEFGRIDILVNNAGICPRTALEEITEKEWDRVLAVNLKGAFFLYQKALPWLERRPGGCVVNIASGAGKIGGVQVGAHYSASKAGLICLTKTMALHGARYGIRANAVCPGVIGTGMTMKLSRRQLNRYKKAIPLGRIGSEREVASAVLFLVSEAASYMTGEILDVNGGFIMD